MRLIVVNLNYRVGPYGFLASDEIREGGSLNNGLKDQRQAFFWIKEHISKVPHANEEATVSSYLLNTSLAVTTSTSCLVAPAPAPLPSPSSS